MASLQPRVFVENLPEKRIAEAILGRYHPEIVDGFTASAATALAELSLLEHPERPVAVLLNTRTEDPAEIDEVRSALRRILARASPSGWYVALAVPRLDAWAM